MCYKTGQVYLLLTLSSFARPALRTIALVAIYHCSEVAVRQN
jgi:hypothetical protein